MKKYFILCLSLVITLTTILPTISKAESEGVNFQEVKETQDLITNEIQNDENVKITEVIDLKTGKTYQTIFNKIDSSFETTEINNTTPERSKIVLDSKELLYDLQQSEVNAAAASNLRIIDSGANANNKYKYLSYTQNIWVLYSDGKSKVPVESSKNRTQIYNFRSTVNSLRASELRTSLLLGTASSATIIAGITAPIGWAAALSLLTAIGAGGAAIDSAYNSYSLAKDARWIFDKVTLK